MEDIAGHLERADKLVDEAIRELRVAREEIFRSARDLEPYALQLDAVDRSGELLEMIKAVMTIVDPIARALKSNKSWYLYKLSQKKDGEP